MHIQAITLFGEMFEAITGHGVTGRAANKGLWQLDIVNPRQFADNPLGYIDDRPFGGGPGMIMAAPPLQAALDFAREKQPDARMIYMSPQGKPLTHEKVFELSRLPAMIVLCGRYEGIDERILLNNPIEEISIGDFVVSGGELPAMILMDAVLRLIPGVLGDSRSAQQDSFVTGRLDCPHYTRPVEFQNMKVPEVLLGGNHGLIAQWRFEQSLRRTVTRRPDLLATHSLTPKETELLQNWQKQSEIQS